MEPTEQLEFQEIEVLCPHCGRREGKEVGWLRTHHELTCPACSRPFPLDRDLIVCAIQDLERDLKESDSCEPSLPERTH